ncbi:hypothetical protein ACLK18_24920 [Escherichia coli]
MFHDLGNTSYLLWLASRSTINHLYVDCAQCAERARRQRRSVRT